MAEPKKPRRSPLIVRVGNAETFGKCIKEQLQSGMFADCEMVCGSHVQKAHKVIVCCQSKVLNAALTGHFKESQTSKYVFMDDNWQLVRRMLESFYTGTYPDRLEEYEGQPGEPESDLELHFKMAVLADKYQADLLFNLAESQALSWLECPDRELDELLEVAQMIYDGPERMKHWRQAFVSNVRFNLIRADADSDVMTEFIKMTQIIPEFGKNMMMHLSVTLQAAFEHAYAGFADEFDNHHAEALREVILRNPRKGMENLGPEWY